MASQHDLPALLRFLTQTASIPLTQALALAKPLHTASQTPTTLATSTLSALKSLLGATDPDGRFSKQILAAARRASKKRDSASTSDTSPAAKRRRSKHELIDPAEREQKLKLPAPFSDLNIIRNTVLVTNRAPLLLAFAVVALKYSMPIQPETSRLSLAMAVMSAGAKARARDLGIEPPRDPKGSGANEGPGRGYKSVRVLGREVPILRRDVDADSVSKEVAEGGTDTKDIDKAAQPPKDLEPAYWGLDMEALHDPTASSITLPIHTPESAHAYLHKSFATAPPPDANPSADTKKTKASAATAVAARVHNLTLLLGALDALFASWAPIIDAAELDRRAWTWYARVRPAVEEGKRGWGGKGELRLAEILDFRHERTN